MKKRITDSGYILGRVVVEESATTDTYSDGDIENVMLEIVKANKEEEILATITNVFCQVIFPKKSVIIP